MMPVLPPDPDTAGGGVTGLGPSCSGCPGRSAWDSTVRSPDWIGTAGGASGSIRAGAGDGVSSGVSARATPGFCFDSGIVGTLGVVSTGTADATGEVGVATTAGACATATSPATDAVAGASSEGTVGDVVRAGSA